MTGEVGARLRVLRRRAGLSQRRLALVAGVSSDTVRVLESGRAAGITLFTLSALAAALGVTPGTLLGERPAAPVEWLPGGAGWVRVRAEVEALRGVA